MVRRQTQMYASAGDVTWVFFPLDTIYNGNIVLFAGRAVSAMVRKFMNL